MEFEFPKPEKAIKFLEEFKDKKKELNLYNNNENLKNFLEVNNSKYNISQSKIDILLYNFEKNTVFNFLDENKKLAFILLQRGKLNYSLPQEKIYKLFLYFYGAVPIEELGKILYKLSDKSIRKLDFKSFIENNISELFNTYNFPKNLSGEYPLLRELIPLIKENNGLLKKMEYWEENFLEYLGGEYETKFVKDIIKKFLKRIDGVVYDFFEENNEIKIEKILIRRKKVNKRLYKITIINLIKKDDIVFIEEEKNKSKSFISENEKYFLFYHKGINKITLENLNEDNLVKENIFTEFSLLTALEYDYPLNKIYSIKMKLKRLFSKEK